MGCAASLPVSIEVAIDQAQTNPAKGLASINSALGQSKHDENCKKNIPKVFELLPKAVGSLSVKDEDVKAVATACTVIERCVNLANDPSVGFSAPTLDAAHVDQCTNQLTILMKNALEKCMASFNESGVAIKACSSDIKAIAAAMKALLKLEDHATSCRNMFNMSGMTVAVNCMKRDSGLTMDCKHALLSMFATLLESPDCVHTFIGVKGTYELLPYCGDPKIAANQEFQQLCMQVLETCISSGQEVKNKAEVQSAIQTVKNKPESSWGFTFSRQLSGSSSCSRN